MDDTVILYYPWISSLPFLSLLGALEGWPQWISPLPAGFELNSATGLTGRRAGGVVLFSLMSSLLCHLALAVAVASVVTARPSPLLPSFDQLSPSYGQHCFFLSSRRETFTLWIYLTKWKYSFHLASALLVAATSIIAVLRASTFHVCSLNRVIPQE